MPLPQLSLGELEGRKRQRSIGADPQEGRRKASEETSKAPRGRWGFGFGVLRFRKLCSVLEGVLKFGQGTQGARASDSVRLEYEQDFLGLEALNLQVQGPSGV